MIGSLIEDADDYDHVARVAGVDELVHPALVVRRDARTVRRKGITIGSTTPHIVE